MEVYRFPHFDALVHIALFNNVQNASSLRTRLVTASKMEGEGGLRERAAVNFALIDAKLVTSLTALETAIHHAVLAEEQGTLRTKYIHSEILWALNPTNNISEGIRRFGIADTTTSLVVISVSKLTSSDATEMLGLMESVVQGHHAPLNQLPTDWAAVKKYYKLSADSSLQGLSEEDKHRQFDKIVTSIIALKPVAI